MSNQENELLEEVVPLNIMNSPQTCVMMDVEEVPLNIVDGSGEAQKHDTCRRGISRTERAAAFCCNDDHHRKLAICSIICGLSCIGCKALINSVKAETTTDPEAAERFSQQAKKFGIISIVTWFSILVSIPLLMALISYLLTFQD